MEHTPYDDLPAMEDLAPSKGIAADLSVSLRTHLYRLRDTMGSHPAPVLAWAETVFWALVAFSVLDHLFNRNGLIGTAVWWLTIGPHEIGHLVCTPFGTLLMFVGGTFWQVAFWLIIGIVELLSRRRLRVALTCAALVGHSLINAAVYIGDAQTRDLPLLFGMSSDHHDWYNILNMLGLLPLDGVLAFLTRVLGVFVVFAAALAGMYIAWMGGNKRKSSGRVVSSPPLA